MELFQIDEMGMVTEVRDVKEANWVHLCQPTMEEINQLHDIYEMPKDYLTSVLDFQEISRIEGFYSEEKNKPKLVLMQFSEETMSPSGFRQIDTSPFSIILVDNHLITAGDYTTTVLQKIANQPSFNKRFEGVDFAKATMLKICWYIAYQYNDQIRQLRDSIETLESELRVATENEQLYQLMDTQKSLIFMIEALKQNVKVIEDLKQHTAFATTSLEKELLRDVLVEFKQAHSSAETLLKVASELGNMFSSIVSNNQNNVMKVLTSITIVLTVPTIVGGIYGMNVALPFAESPFAFWFVSLLILLLSVIIIWQLKKNKFF